MYKKFILGCFFFFLPFMVFSQVLQKRDSLRVKDTTSVSRNNRTTAVPTVSDSIATIDMYKIISIERDTTYVDTSLTIQNEYAENYLRKDIFGLLPFHNIGQTYNTLDYGLNDYTPFPEFGFRAKHFAYMEVEDINYYHVATPFTDLFYRSVLEQGQILDASVTVNTSDNLNLTVGYKGLRSIGKYINSLSSNGNFRLITSYNTTDRRYILKLHMAAQDFSNQENGGIVNTADFESSEPPFDERARLEVYFNDAYSLLKGNRYFIDHTFRLNKSNPNSIVLHHRFNYEHKLFEYTQPTPSARFGRALTSSIYDKTRYNRMYNMFGAAYSNETIGDIEFYIEDYNYNYYYNSIVLNAEGGIAIPNSLSDRINTYGARYSYQKDKWKGSVLLSNSITDQSLANIDASARYTFDEKNSVSLRYQNMNKLPNLNFRLFQSDYESYNWSKNFNNEKINNFEVEAKTKWVSASLQYSILKDHLYFFNEADNTNPADIDSLLVKPEQYDNTINYLSLKVNKEFKFWKLALDNTVLYQQVDQSDKILNVPEFVTRNTLYFSDHFFKKALYLQTGFTFQYFTSYYANDYNPLIGEFYIQEKKKIGDYPLIDFFINAKIQTFRVFFKAEHFNSNFTGYDYYAAPNQPYRDFTIRFGVIWDFFT
ncbi:putative porin [Flavobacterium sp. LaA7.5]|nr:putative porin [Flavobacterium salilacus subsp. altitudinum]